MRAITIALLLGSLFSASAAQAQSGNVYAAADKKMKSIHRVHGVAGMKAEIYDCYTKFNRSPKLAAAQRCYAQHRVASGLDAAFSQMMGRDVRDDFLREQQVYALSGAALQRLGYDADRRADTLAAWANAAPR